MSEPIKPMTQHGVDQARRNKRLALIHVGIALAVLAFFVFNIVSK